MRLMWIDIVVLGAVAAGLWLAPWKDPAARRRAWWLLLLPVPALLLIVFGPIVLFPHPSDPSLVRTLTTAQYVGMWASLAVVAGLAATLRGLRWASLFLGAVAVLGTVAVGGVNQIILTPGS